jgi:hypothetical protein
MEFNIPKKHFTSDEDDKLLVVKMPQDMLEALKAHEEALGWSYTGLIDLILDQFFASIEGRSRLPDHDYNYDGGERQTVSLRLDRDLYNAIRKWAEKPAKPKISQLLFLAIDVYLSQSKISK